MDPTCYKGFTIKPQRFYQKYLIKGRYISTGFVVVKGGCNIMPGAIWFESEYNAQEAIDVFIVTGNTPEFWIKWRENGGKRV